MFAKFTQQLSRHLISADEELAAQATAHASNRDSTSSVAYNPNKLDELFDMLSKYENNFLKHLKILLDALNYLAATETVVFLGLCARLSTAVEGVPGMTVGTYS